MKRVSNLGLWIGLVVLIACSSHETTASDAAGQLHALFDREWDFRTREDPFLATYVGRHEHNHLVPSVTVEDQQRRVTAWQGMLAELDEIERSQLDPSDQVNADIFRSQLENFIEEFEAGAYQIPLTVDDGFHIGFARLPGTMPFADRQDFENYIARLRAFPGYVEQHIEHMRTGLERGMTLSKVVLEGYDITIKSHIVDEASVSVFYRPFEHLPDSLSEEDANALRQEGSQVILESVVNGYRSFLDFMLNEYIPGARTTLGASELPNGEAYYAQRIRHFTTLNLTAEEVHQLGLDEVARIRAEMMEIIEQVGFEGDFAAFLNFLRTDPRFYAETAEELLKEAAFIAKTMDGKLPTLFKTLPRMPYGVAAVPDHLAPKYTTGRYVGAPVGGTRSGTYWVNTYALENRPLYVLTALTLHEAVPGHHLQISLSQELDELPLFRRHSYLSAFGEGWGLYSEWLGLEAGLYQDPYRNFGRLTYEMWRACRLVVDTGLHAKGWTRQQTLDYMASNTALSLHEVRTETDRYISWPGQALAYKIGELKIKELRREAEEKLGDRFDVREFHHTVLKNGSVPLPVLESVVRAYIADHSAPAPPPR